MAYTNRCTPNRGSTSTTKCTWSAMVPTSINQRRYFGHHTT